MASEEISLHPMNGHGKQIQEQDQSSNQGSNLKVPMVVVTQAPNDHDTLFSKTVIVAFVIVILVAIAMIIIMIYDGIHGQKRIEMVKNAHEIFRHLQARINQTSKSN